MKLSRFIENKNFKLKKTLIDSAIFFFTAIYLASIPFESVLAINGKTISRSLGVFCSFLIIANLLTNRRKTFKLDKSLILWGAFFSWALLSLMWTQYFEITIQSFWIHVRFFLFICLLYLYSFSEKELKVLISISIFSVIITAIILIYLYMNNVTYLTTVRASLVRGESSADPNHTAAGLLLGLSFIINILIFRRRIISLINLFYFFSILIIIFAIILTGSRAGLLGAATVIFISLFYGKHKTKYLISGILILLFSIGSILYIRKEISQDLKKRYEIYEITSSGGAGRLQIWLNGIEIWEKKPIWGHGMGTFGELHLVNAGIWKVAHNIYLQILVELGLVGFILLLIIIWSLLNYREKCDSYIRIGSQSALIGILVVSFFLGTLNYDYLWSAIFLSIASRNIQQYN